MNYLLIEVLQENKAGGGSNDGGEASDGSSIRDAQRKALADHLVMLRLILPVDFLVLRAGGLDT